MANEHVKHGTMDGKSHEMDAMIAYAAYDFGLGTILWYVTDGANTFGPYASEEEALGFETCIPK